MVFPAVFSGFACTEVGLAAPNLPCAAGYYCLDGATIAEPTNEDFGDVCPAGFFCPEGITDQAVIHCVIFQHKGKSQQRSAVVSCDLFYLL